MKGVDLTGQKFSRWTVLKRIESDKNGKSMYLCLCDCGTEKSVYGFHLRSKKSLSCGCIANEINAARCRTHGKSHTSEYKAWFGIIQRCTNKKNVKWHRYGGRGITVCERWFDYSNFLADMGKRPNGCSLDRINNDGNYEPANCRWATPIEQASNRSNNVFVNVNGKKITASQASRLISNNRSTVSRRLRNGWDENKAVNLVITHKG